MKKTLFILALLFIISMPVMFTPDAKLITRALYQTDTVDWQTIMLPAWLADKKLMTLGLKDCELSFDAEKDAGSAISFLVAAYGGDNVDNSRVEAYIIRLIKQGCSVDVLDEEGMTPLHSAVLFNQPDLVKFLLENGADMRKKISRPGKRVDGMQPLKFAKFLFASNDNQKLKDIIKIFKNKK